MKKKLKKIYLNLSQEKQNKINSTYLYTWYRKLKPLENKIVIESNFGNKLACNSLGLYELIIQNPKFADTKIIIVDNKLRKFKGAKSVSRNSRQYFYHVATCKMYFNNMRYGEKVIPRKGQKLIQMWHGIPLKKLGHDMVGFEMNSGDEATYKRNLDSEVKRWDIMFSPNKYTSEKYMSAFKFNKQIIETGNIRNYKLFKENDLESIKRKHNIDPNKKVIMYAPTFRDDSKDERGLYIQKLDLDLSILNQNKECFFIIRKHYMTQYLNLDKFDNIIDGSYIEELEELFLITDVLITDYSSLMFDFSILKKPVILYSPDLNKYENKLRGFYFDYNILSDTIHSSADEVYTTLNNHSYKPLNEIDYLKEENSYDLIFDFMDKTLN